jgi:hypothetical protein
MQCSTVMYQLCLYSTIIADYWSSIELYMFLLLAVLGIQGSSIQGSSKDNASSDTIATITSLRGGTSDTISNCSSNTDIPRHTIDNCYIEFTGTKQVTVKHEIIDRVTDVGPNQVLIKTVCSSISSGTEMKVLLVHTQIYIYIHTQTHTLLVCTPFV